MNRELAYSLLGWATEIGYVKADDPDLTEYPVETNDRTVRLLPYSNGYGLEVANPVGFMGKIAQYLSDGNGGFIEGLDTLRCDPTGIDQQAAKLQAICGQRSSYTGIIY